MTGKIQGHKDLGFSWQSLEIQCQLQTKQQIGLILYQSADGSETAKPVFDPAQGQLRLEGSLILNPPLPLPLKAHQPLELHIFIDVTTLEVFCQGQALSTHIYPQQPSLGLCLHGQAVIERLEVWELAISHRL
mgnify:CR=1 FL=1